MQQMLTLLSCRIYSSSVFCSDTICIPVHDLEKSMRPGWGWSATSSFPPLPPGVARRPGGSSSIWWWTPWGSELDAAPASEGPQWACVIMSQLSVSVLMVFFKLCMVPWFSGERQWLSTSIFSPLLRFYVGVTSNLAPALGARGVGWVGVVFRGSHPVARAYSGLCLLMIPSMDTWGMF